jgi:formyl-CoA transferase
MSITGAEAGEPQKVGVALVDVLTGKDAVIGILASLATRERCGRGEHLEVTLLTSLLGGMANQAASFLETGVPPRRMGNRHPSIAPYETLRCADGLLAVACGNDRQFSRLVELIGRSALATDARFATNPDRVAHREALVAELESALAGAPAVDWERRLTAAGVPAGRVSDIGEAVSRAEALDLQPVLDLGSQTARQIRHPIQYVKSRTACPTPPPRLGEHNSLLRDWLAQPFTELLRHPSAGSEYDMQQ